MSDFRISIGPNVRKSVYYDATVADGVRSFSVYNHMLIPCDFGDPAAEYDRLVNGVVMWDVAVQRQVEFHGPDAEALVQYLTTRDIYGAKIGQGLYVPLCDYAGTLINDPVLLKIAQDRFWMSIADSDIALWGEAIAREKGWDVAVTEPDVSPLAIQGPKAVDLVADLFGDWIRDLRYFWFRETELDGMPLILSRSGWSKQGGFELYLRDGARGTELYDRVKGAGRAYGIGPGAPHEVERVESALISYGGDARRQTLPANPFELGLGKLVYLDKPGGFVGRDALAAAKETGIRRHRVGLVVEGDPVHAFEHPVPVFSADGTAFLGHATVCIWSASRRRNLALALVSTDLAAQGAEALMILDRKPRKCRTVRIPFAEADTL